MDALGLTCIFSYFLNCMKLSVLASVQLLRHYWLDVARSFRSVKPSTFRWRSLLLVSKFSETPQEHGTGLEPTPFHVIPLWHWLSFDSHALLCAIGLNPSGAPEQGISRQQ